ncbi:uncharacterized protein OCT59_003956 [Rhizophagus irregularis]|uniref:ZZ-type domain-containing protein n=2 Tax=Rhizophagus irregularis TaxID=588596 RepID=A0A916EDU7_9GLOM|nr:hypothetical protein RirG_088570 [Rhizophagus irregularis DAOM 197198w]UZO12419.1 hypothetical protein OCT59_003956 [Rhizophagus irregularis]CAB4377613.1 unnamed protein product [Rhizophagus irregularis]CAB4468646.1 unnamed protein product [Rhizophagus irregularis]CAB5177152.1 unnamed protein product [Rhizophagus irregularis]
MMKQTTSSNSNNNNNNNNNKDLNELKQLKSKYYESELEKDGLNTLVESLKTKIRTLQQQIFSQESSVQLNQDLESQKEILLEKVNNYKKRINDSDLQLNIIKKELSTLREENNDYIKKHNELQQENVQIRQLNNLLELDKQHLNKKLREYEDEKIILQKELRQCNEQSTSIEDNINEIKSSFEKLDADYRVLQCKNSELELEIENLQCEVKRLREKCVLQYNEIDESNKLNDKLKGDINDLNHLFIEQERVLREKNQQENGIHPAYCNVCNKYIVGVRYKCGHCDDFDICSNCETSNHDRNHVFIKIKRPIINDRFVKTALLPEFQFIEQNEQDIDHKAICNVCHKKIRGVRYKCGHCAKFEMCVNCEAYPFNLHDQTHVFIKIRRPVQIDSNENLLPSEFRSIVNKPSNI